MSPFSFSFLFFFVSFFPFSGNHTNFINKRKSIADRRTFEVFVKDKAWTNSGFDGNRKSYESVACDRAICQSQGVQTLDLATTAKAVPFLPRTS